MHPEETIWEDYSEVSKVMGRMGRVLKQDGSEGEGRRSEKRGRKNSHNTRESK